MPALLVLLIVLAGAAPAHAATARVRTVEGGIKTTVIELVAAPGERNDVSVALNATEVVFEDRGVRPTAGSGCVAAISTARCGFPVTAPDDLQILLVAVRGGDGNDRIRMLRPTGTPPTAPVVVIGATGDDGADDVGIDSPPMPAEEADPNAAFVLSIAEGGSGDDVLAGGEGTEFLGGGSGRDTLRAGAGDDSLGGDTAGILDAFLSIFTAGPPESETPQLPPEEIGDDVLDGGAGVDAVNYSARRQAVTVDLVDPGADGSPGEADALTGFEDVQGGSGANDLRGDDGPNRLVGSAGADRLTGGGGDDELDGSGGSNVIDAGAGDDLLLAPGRGSSCGSGRDRVRSGIAPLRLPLWRECESMSFGVFDEAELKLRPVRRSGKGLSFEATTVGPQRFTGSGVSSRVLVDVRKPGGRVVARGRIDIPGDGEAGRTFRLRVPLTAYGRRNLRRLKVVRVKLVAGSSRPTVDLPVAN